ncbi:MAG: low specificity L-threonine aldolase [Deltaproteobacteria bacterium]|nr:low specificity L-threonine aldolase [Deltaproteobacteria bacterium]
MRDALGMPTTQKLIDLASDTATRPTPAMKAAMCEAPLGDEQRREDPTTLALEERAAALLGTECALFLPSATLANQIAIALHCRSGDEVLCHKSAHVFNYETGAASMISQVQLQTLAGRKGIFTGEDVKNAVRDDDPHLPRTRLVVVENTSNGGGGTVWPDEAFASVVVVCRERDLKLHIDGARLMNAAVAHDVEPSFWGARADTVQLCFSKGLGAPFGAVLGMKEEDFWRARRLKQGLGGALRQSGIIAAAALYGLEHHVEKLSDDHRRAAAFAAFIDATDGLVCTDRGTNLVFFRVEKPGKTAAALLEYAAAQNVRLAQSLDGRIRACFHLDVTDEDVARAQQVLLDGTRRE